MENKQKEWKKVEMAPAWNRIIDQATGQYSLEVNDELVGIYVDKEEDVGDNHSTIYNFKTADGMVSVWDTTVLSARLKNIEAGEEVRIVYLGKKPNKTKGRKPYHNFEVYHRKPDFIPVINEEKPKSFQEQIDA